MTKNLREIGDFVTRQNSRTAVGYARCLVRLVRGPEFALLTITISE